MSKELVISANRHETRVAVIEEDQVVEVYYQRENEYSLAGSIHKGRVTRVLPGMQSAFVDIGLGRDAFLYVSDFFEDNEEYDKIVTSVEEQVLKLNRPPGFQSPLQPQPQPQPITGPVSLESRAAGTPVAQDPGASAAAVHADGAPASIEQVIAPAVIGIPPAAGGAPDQRRDGRDVRDSRDSRGRRTRRRRGGQSSQGGQRAGGRLPDSKYYSPRPEASSETSPDPVAQAPVVLAERHPAGATPAPAAGDDDFFVLPGESLAKYTGPSAQPEEVLEDQSVEDTEVAEPAAASAPEPEREPEREPEHEPELEPELAPHVVAAFEAAVEEIDATPAEFLMPPESIVLESIVETESGESAARESAESESAGSSSESEEPSALAAESAAAEPAMEQAVTRDEGSVEEEGPEPARIPTSLTATLREQNPRYLQHRVSRRMRRKGGRPDDPSPRSDDRGPRPEASRSLEGRGDPRPEPPPEQRPDARTAEARPERTVPSISDLLKEGQEIIVQIAKEPLGQKGARITSHIALPGRFLVYMPTVDHIGVSRKIPSDDERLRLKRILQSNRTGIPGGYIVRTAGDGRTEEELRADMMFLYNLWLDMRQKAERRPAPLLIHHDLNVVERILRDQLTSSFKSIWVDNEELYESVLGFVQRFQPAMVSRVKLYTRSTPIFDEFNITSELEKALRPKVWLKSGGYIVINQTEALVAIDVNTGKYVGKSNRLEDTIVKTNTDAIQEIVRQIRLRDLGGIIVVDFIDMDERKNRQKVMQTLEEAMRADRAPNKILQFNDFGLVAITRKRVKQSLERTLCTPCDYCGGAGYVKSAQTVVGEILQEAHKISRAVEGKDVLLRVSPEVARLLKSNQNSYLPEIEEILGGRTVIVKSDPLLHQEKFDLA
jgi:ribonuclease G